MRALRQAVLVLLAVFPWANQATAGEIRFGKMPSAVLGRDMPYVVYLPVDYVSGAERLPILYMLHGAGGDETSWAAHGHIFQVADDLIAKKQMPRTIIAMPGCRGCWWIDGKRDKAETAFWSEFDPYIERTYGGIPGRNGRMLAGLSAGGYGAIGYALRHPGRVAAVAAFSPAIYALTPPVKSSARRQHAFVDSHGMFDQKAWQELSYSRLLPGYMAQSHRVPMFLVSGDHDRFGIAFETALFFKEMFERQPELVEFRVIDGDHSWDVWTARLSAALKYMSRFVATPEPLPPVAAPRRPAMAYFAE